MARTMRWAMVASLARNARAISPVSRPPSRRRVRATRESCGSTGWQAMNISRSTSSPTVSSSRCSARAATSSCSCSSSQATCTCFSSRSFRWRRRSMARLRAVVISQAPGLSGTPSAGHFSSAATSASWASSSARPTSRTIRVRPPITRADSIRQTASMVRAMSTWCGCGLMRGGSHHRARRGASRDAHRIAAPGPGAGGRTGGKRPWPARAPGSPGKAAARGATTRHARHACDQEAPDHGKRRRWWTPGCSHGGTAITLPA
ncbi:hypothetical protein L613_008100000160 [Pseudoxanthomonas taiwanensis J19]|uniref:Uncharacterized protein n=1 Tax=Pseudoxanthomonas taiwanensis J19 TaxID=935569 RepID=A0A562D112_9GAMM|nr:hypothetical protein L613_008100000160 [Pseudoxanthomonas taiwanensis J19]